MPDLSLLEPLAKALGVSVAELLSGEYRTNANRAGNLLRSQWYVCPVCGNVVYALGQGSFHCCGVALPPAEAPPHSSENSPAPGHRPHCRRQDRHTTDCAADCRPDWRWSGTPRTAVPPPRPPGPWPGAPAERGPASPFRYPIVKDIGVI